MEIVGNMILSDQHLPFALIQRGKVKLFKPQLDILEHEKWFEMSMWYRHGKLNMRQLYDWKARIEEIEANVFVKLKAEISLKEEQKKELYNRIQKSLQIIQAIPSSMQLQPK